MNSSKRFGVFGIAAVLLATAGYVAWKSTQTQPKRVVAIATLVSHPALDSLLENLKTQLAAEGFRDGENIRIETRNASGQVQLATGIARELAALEPAVSVGITTPVAQAMAKVSRGPFVFAAVTDPVGARIVKSLDVPEPLVTGAADSWPYQDQLKLIREINPNIKRVAVIFNPGDTASQFGMKQIRKYAAALGLELIDGPVGSAGEVFGVADNIASGADAIYLSSDAAAISGVAGAAKVAMRRQIPLFVGDSGTVEKGGMAAVAIGYDRLGVETGKLVARFLRGETNLPIVSPDGKSSVVVNTKAAQLMGVQIPESVLQRAKVFNEIKQ
jgi:putative ABC transport system substrate-binding protein